MKKGPFDTGEREKKKPPVGEVGAPSSLKYYQPKETGRKRGEEEKRKS